MVIKKEFGIMPNSFAFIKVSESTFYIINYFKRSGFCFKNASQPVYDLVSEIVPELK